MIWNRKPNPKIGDRRWVRKFAYFPITINIAKYEGWKYEQDENIVTIWLEFYYAKQVYSNCVYDGPFWDTYAYSLKEPEL
jgi:hypothetical protein